jgi:hypothetical protein
MDGNKIMKKILGAFRKGSAEKMEYFYSSIELSIGKKEKSAIALRNKMTHSYRDYSNEETAHQDVVYTRIYEMLFNRTILKLLGYNEYYIDYSLQNCPLKHINIPAHELGLNLNCDALFFEKKMALTFFDMLALYDW